MLGLLQPEKAQPMPFAPPADALVTMVWWACQDSNLEPKDYESSALTIELQARCTGIVAAANKKPRIRGALGYCGWREA